jgi:excisionase family DNA binding protein
VSLIGDTAQAVIQSLYRTGRGSFVSEWPSWSVKQASEKTGYNPEYIRRLIREGKVEAVQVGRVYLIRIESLQGYINSLDEGDRRTGPRPKS